MWGRIHPFSCDRTLSGPMDLCSLSVPLGIAVPRREPTCVSGCLQALGTSPTAQGVQLARPVPCHGCEGKHILAHQSSTGHLLMYAWCSARKVVVGLEVSTLEQTIGTRSSESVKITCVSKGWLVSCSGRVADDIRCFFWGSNESGQPWWR